MNVVIPTFKEKTLQRRHLRQTRGSQSMTSDDMGAFLLTGRAKEMKGKVFRKEYLLRLLNGHLGDS